ncbi:MAG: DUF4157 domain-containing protein [Rhizonema sp. NSF051]|nr:DUF4157 domain-containing protein [Rhizonema sp. NSF051]
MVYERIQKPVGQTSSQKKQTPLVPPLSEEPTQASSQSSHKINISALPSKEKRDVIKRKLLGNLTEEDKIQAQTQTKPQSTLKSSHKVNISALPSKEERDAIKRKLLGSFTETNNIQSETPESSLIAGTRIQAKLMIGAPGDKYEQEANKVATQVVNQISAPVAQQKSQNLQQQNISSEEEKLQMKPILQLQAGVSGVAATPDLESSIQQARSGGQPLADQVRKPMEQAFGADFSGVKVHTDTQADQLNQSIQAKAFTTGQDVFFRQGAYEPGSRGGQELIAHELTHVVQQNGGSVKRSPETTVQAFYEVDNVQISKGLNIVLEDKKTVYASQEKLDEANTALDQKESKFLLAKGKTKTYGGNFTFYKVVPRYNPRTTDQATQDLNPVMGDSDEIIRQKHETYMQKLHKVETDLKNFSKKLFEDLIDTWNWKFKDAGGRKSALHLYVNKWLKNEPYREELLLRELSPITFEFLNHQSKPKLLEELANFTQRFQSWIALEDNFEGAISLPNDCAQCVQEVIGGKGVTDRQDPQIGENYHIGLKQPKSQNLGWNFHWAGVIMQDDGDNVSLESAAGMSLTFRDKQTWWFGMYGTEDPKQTFVTQIEKIHYQRNIEMLTDLLPEYNPNSGKGVSLQQDIIGATQYLEKLENM